jgi:hypothetical protein
MNQTIRLIAHALLGAALGVFTSLVFLLLYFGIEYTAPVTDAIRFRVAFWDTVIISGVILLLMFWRNVWDFLTPIAYGEDDDR